MNSQMKDRKSRRRFARLMSLALSTSLVLGNVVFAYAGVENPNVPLSEGPNVSIEEEVIAEGNAADGEQEEIDISNNDNYTISSVSLDGGNVSVNPVADPNKELEKLFNEKKITLISASVVSKADATRVILSTNKNSTQLSLNKVSLSESKTEIDTKNTTKVAVELKVVSENGDPVVSAADGKHYKGIVKGVVSGSSVSWNDEGTSKKPININNEYLKLAGYNTDNIQKDNIASENLAQKQSEITQQISQNVSVSKNWGTEGEVLKASDLQVDIKWNTTGNKSVASLTVTADKSKAVGGLYFDGSMTVSEVATINIKEGGITPSPTPGGEKEVSIADNTVSVNLVVNPTIEYVSSNDQSEVDKALAVFNNRIDTLEVVSAGDGKPILSDGDLNIDFKKVEGDVTASSNGNVYAEVRVTGGGKTVNGVSYNGTARVDNVASIVLSENGGGVDPKPPVPTVNRLSVSPIKTDWDGKKVTISSDTVTTYALYMTDKAVATDADLKDLTPVSANRALVSKNDVYTTSDKDVNKYIVARISDDKGVAISSCYVDKAALSKVTLDNTNIQMEIKDGKIVKGTLPKVLSVNDKKSPSANTSANSFEVKWAIDAAKAKKGDDVKVSVAPASTNQYYTGSQTVTVGKVASVTTTTTKPTTKKNQSMKVTPTSLTFKVGDTKAKTLKVKNAKGAITVTVDKKGKKVIKVTPNKAKTSIKVVPKTKKAAGVATITIKAAGDKTYKAATKKVTVTVMPKQKPTAKVSGVKVVSKKTKTAKVTWKAIKNDKKVNGYQIQYAASKKALSKGKIVTVTGAKKATYTIKKLKKGKKVFVRVRAVNTKNGASNPSKKWSAVKSCKVK